MWENERKPKWAEHLSDEEAAHRYRLAQTQWLLDDYKRRHGVAATSIDDLEQDLLEQGRDKEGPVSSDKVNDLVDEYIRLSRLNEPDFAQQVRLRELWPIFGPDENAGSHGIEGE